MKQEQIIKALECCAKDGACPFCPLREDFDCITTMARDALSLIRELTEERDGLKQHNNYLKGMIDHAFAKELRSFDENSAVRAAAEAEMWRMIALREKLRIEENEKLKAENAEQDEAIIKALQRMGEVRRETQADTVRKMQERLKEKILHSVPTVYNSHFGRLIDQIAKELLEDTE